MSDVLLASSEPPAAAAGPGGAVRALVLMVERNLHVRDLAAYSLGEAGYDVRFAADGPEALATARRERPAVVITEVLVPKLDGLALCRTLKTDAATRGTAVLVCSVLAAAGRAREAGADAFLLKPLSERRLVDTVRTLMAAHANATHVNAAHVNTDAPPPPPLATDPA